MKKEIPFALFFVGVIWGVCIASIQSPLMRHPIHELTAYERKQPMLQQAIPPMTFEVTILSHAEFAVKRSSEYVYAFTRMAENPCHIYLEEGKLIDFNPSDQGSARWDDQMDADTSAHELLHCIDGQWHGGN